MEFCVFLEPVADSAAATASKSGIEVNVVLIKDEAFKANVLPEAQRLYENSHAAKERILHAVFG